MKRDIRTQTHSFYDCKYHIVFTPKYRGKVLRSNYIKQEVRRVIRLVCKWKWFEIVEWHVALDHVHLILIIPPKHSISYAMSMIKWKSSNWIKKKNKNLKLKCKRWSFWARGYFVSTIGLDAHMIRRYVQNQELHHQEDLQGVLF